ncbi:MAG TPA: MATE family efflux transporter [Thioalkalivibrio sp.]|nr:MATE family efflux transporter [Thioalkalivibrio sp.]
MKDRAYELGHERVGRLLLRYSTPAIIAMTVNSLYNVVDTVFVGRGAGTLALAALAVSFPIQMFILAIAQVVGIGSASIISRALGAGDLRHAERTAGTSFAAVTVLSLLLTAGGLAFLKPLLRLFGATPEVLPYGIEYLSVIMGGAFFFAFAVSSHNIVRAEGNVKMAMYSMILGAVVNVILDPVFIFGLGLGIRGAAIATVIAQSCSFAFLIWYFRSGRSLLRMGRLDLRPDVGVLPEMFAIGASSLARVAAGSAMAIVLNNSIAHYGENVHLAVMGVIQRALMLFLMPQFGLIQGLQPIVGFNYGAGNTARVHGAVHRAVVAATALSSVGFGVLMLLPTPILSLFSSDPVLIDAGRGIVRVVIAMFPVVGYQIVGASLFQALGKAGPALFLSMSRQVLFLVPLTLLLPLWLGLGGIWWSFPAADGLSVVVTAVWVRHEMRLLRGHASAHEVPSTAA